MNKGMETVKEQGVMGKVKGPGDGEGRPQIWHKSPCRLYCFSCEAIL